MCCGLQPKTLRYSNGCLTVLAIIVVAVVLALSKVASNGYKTGNIFVESSLNWYREVIINVNTVDPKTGKCEYENTPLYEYKFKGLKAGCDCSANGGKVKTGACSASDTGCQNVKEIKKTVMQNWVDGTGKPIRLCYQRLINYKFSQKFLREGKCRDPTNEKMCGGSDPMTAFCVPKSQKCPVQSISTSQINPSDEPIGTTGLWIQRDIPNKGHLSESYISQKEGMCQDYLYQYFGGFQNDLYPLLVENDGYKCPLDTTYWQKVQEITYADFFKANDFDSTTFPGLVASRGTILQQRKYMPWNMSCRGGSDLEDMVKIAINYINDSQFHEFFFKVAIADLAYQAGYLFLLILGCFTTQIKRKCCVYRECCKVNCCCCPCLKNGFTISWCAIRSPSCIRKWWVKKDASDSCCSFFKFIDPLHLIFVLIKVGLDIAMIALAVLNFVMVNSYKGTMSDLADKKCSDQLFNDSLKTTSDEISGTVAPLDAVVLAITAIYVVLSLWAVFTYLCNQVSKRRELLKQKLELKKVQILDSPDQTIPTIESNNNLSQTPAQNPNNSIQMQLNPQNPYPNHQNPYTQGQSQNYPILPQTQQQYPAQTQIYPQTGYANQPMFQQPQMYPQQPPYQGTPVYYKPS